jgi:hypothetical protein
VQRKERTPGRNPVAATELGDFWSGLLLKPKAREVSSRRTVWVTDKVYTPGVEQACGEGESVGSEYEWFLGENSFLVPVCFPCNLSLA